MMSFYTFIYEFPLNFLLFSFAVEQTFKVTQTLGLYECLLVGNFIWGWADINFYRIPDSDSLIYRQILIVIREFF